jgi:hypothetical protein
MIVSSVGFAVIKISLAINSSKKYDSYSAKVAGGGSDGTTETKVNVYSSNGPHDGGSKVQAVAATDVSETNCVVEKSTKLFAVIISVEAQDGTTTPVVY